MKKYILKVLLILFLIQYLYAQPKIIFDTDFGADADDLGALVMLHNFVEKGECELLAVMNWNLEQHTAAAIDAVNRFYNHPDIAIGSRKGQTFNTGWNYNKAIADAFEYKRTYDDVPEALPLYRRILSRSEDKSITIVTVGPLKNIQDLLQSSADTISEMSGKKLLEKKVKEFVIMGGHFPSGENEWNFDGEMPGVTKFVLENLPVAVTFSGYEVGEAIKTGEVFNRIEQNHPLYIGFMHFSQNAPWIKENFKGNILNNSTFDQTAVLYAVRNGSGLYWEKISNGYCQADSSGGNRWITGKDSNHSYLKLIYPAVKMADYIESLMLNNF